MIFLNSASSAAALVFDLPLCTLNDTEGKPRKARVWNIFQNLRKNTIFNEHPVCENFSYRSVDPWIIIYNNIYIIDLIPSHSHILPSLNFPSLKSLRPSQSQHFSWMFWRLMFEGSLIINQIHLIYLILRQGYTYILASQKNSPPPLKLFSGFFCGYFAVILAS